MNTPGDSSVLSHRRKPLFSAIKGSCFVAASLTVLGAQCAAAQDSETQEPQSATVLEEVVVTSYRRSLEAARDLKRAMAQQSESIVAEDIGKMPDLNLAESLQRVPGVAITREGGEGRNITVRGLGPGFTRTTLNGMEVPASTGGLDSSGATNRGRDFDFNIFGSELFNRITINKSGVGHIEEGGLASTVELFTRKPFDQPGRSINFSLQGSYNYDSGETDPRGTFVYSDTFADETLGVLVALTRSDRTVHQEGFGTVLWTSPYANGNRSWVGTDADVVINGTPNAAGNHPDADIDPNQQLDYMWHARLPRMDSFNREQERTGYNIALQWQPTDTMELGLDIVGSSLEADVTSYNYYGQFRNLQETITPQEITLDSSGRRIIAGTFDGVKPRSESRKQTHDTEFLQTVVNGSFDLTDAITLTTMYGRATSEHHEEQYRLNLTTIDGHPFTYSFASDSNIAEMSYGFDILDPSLYEWGNYIALDKVDRTNETFRLDLSVEDDASTLRAGLVWNSREVESFKGVPVGLVTPAGVDASNTRAFAGAIDSYGDIIDPPGGFPTNWLVADFSTAIGQFNAGNFAIDPGNPETYRIEEETLGGYVELEIETSLLGRPFVANAGLRVVTTDLSSIGATSDGAGGFIALQSDKSYTDYLPSVNFSWELMDDFLLRLSMGRNLSRPGLGSLVTTASVLPIAGEINIGNPDLNPVRANSIDFGAEWYFAEQSLLSLVFFHKDIDSFITGSAEQNQVLPDNIRAVVAARAEYDPASPGYDPSVVAVDSSDWQIASYVNGDGAELDGFEIGYQHALDQFIDGFGVIANYTHVESEAVFGNGVVGSLEGLSENSYNAGVFYEQDNFGGRLVINDRDDYVTAQVGGTGNASEGTTGPTRMDMSAFYNLTQNITLTLDVINLTNEEERLYSTGPQGDFNLVREFTATGRELIFGLRANF
ncbi:TonB-dependent receptor [Halioxenophilus aromaticivorans]|uniref:TonB-dependent receptor n=1 Tax=Halioxenophilus aromaticivorans TaxID=1306992 RepID=A0AAV3TY58_9ALTE